MTDATLFLFSGGYGDGEAEALVARARLSAARDSIHTALAGGFDRVVVATDTPVSFDGLGASVAVNPDGPGPFDFAARLRDLIERHPSGISAVVGAGALPLLTADDYAALLRPLADGTPRLVTNNLYSGDLTAWTPAEAVLDLADLARDNLLPRRLRDEARLDPVVLPRTTATTFDLDTPADLAVLALLPRLPPGVAGVLDAARLPLEPYRALMRCLTDRDAEILVAGRVGSAAWQYLERETACRVRLVSEERGLAAAPPGHRARSALGFLLEALGPAAFFERLCELGDAVVLDMRVLEAHLGLRPSREDRFQSDLLRPEKVTDPLLRELTAAALAASRPVVLGGHSLVSGGLMALTDAAWSGHELPPR